jgi:hypothetical protein
MILSDFQINQGPVIRPKAQVFSLKNPDCIFIIQTWSDTDVVENLSKLIESQLLDNSKSLPLRLSSARKAAHEHIFKNYNQNAWTELVEIIILAKHVSVNGEVLFWETCGGTQVYLNAENKNLPLSVPPGFSSGQNNNVYFPQRALGLEEAEKASYDSGSCRLQADSKLVLWYGETPHISDWPTTFTAVEEFKSCLLRNRQDSAWVGIIECPA